MKQSVSNPFDNVPDVGEFAFYSSQAAVAPVLPALPALLLSEPMDPFDEHLNVSLHCKAQKGKALKMIKPYLSPTVQNSEAVRFLRSALK